MADMGGAQRAGETAQALLLESRFLTEALVLLRDHLDISTFRDYVREYVCRIQEDGDPRVALTRLRQQGDS